MTAALDEADLVHIAATATRTRPEQVLAACDIAGLVAVAASLDGAATGLDGAALVVLELGRRRPFADGNAAAAWLAAAHLLAGDGLRLRIGHLAATTVFEASAKLGTREVAAVIHAHAEPRRPLLRTVLRRLVGPAEPGGPGVHFCPACDRPLVRRRHDLVAAGMWSDAARLQRIARCAVEHRAHDRHGTRYRPEREVARV